jgi:hypothetical protein
VDTSILFLDSRSRGQEYLVAYVSLLCYKRLFGNTTRMAVLQFGTNTDGSCGIENSDIRVAGPD